MTRQFRTHFAFIFFLHVLLFFGSWTLIEHARTSQSPKTTLLKMMIGHVSEVSTTKVAPKKSSSPVPTSAPAPTPTTQTQVPSALSQGTSALQADLRTLYKDELRSRIEENKFYPAMSRRMGHTGTVVVAFTLLADGKLTNIRLDQSLEYEKLNSAALEAVQRVDHFKPIPKEIGESQMEIKVPVKFVNL